MAGDHYEQVGDLVTLVRGTTYKGALVGKPGPALLGLGSIVPGGGFRDSDFKTYGGECPDKLMLRPGDLYVSLKGATKDGEMIGSVAQVPPRVASGRLTQDTVKLVIAPKFEKLRQYLYWLLRSPQYRAYCAGHATGSAVVAMSREDFLAYPVPRLTAFRASVVALLDALDAKIKVNLLMNETLEAMAQAIFRDWFVDFGPTRRKLEGVIDPVTIMGGLVQDAERARALAKLFPDAMSDSQSPAGWTTGAIGDLADIVGGSTPPTSTSEYWEGGRHLWATPRDLSRLEGLHLFETERRVTDSGLAKIGSGLSPSGTVLLSSRAPIGYLAITTGRTAVNQGFIAIRPNTDLPTSFALCWCRENMDSIKAHANGSTFQEISKGNFRLLPIIDVGRDVRRSFDELVAPMLELCRARSNENRTLAATRDFLLPKLMSGEIRLREAEKSLEASQ